MTTDTAASSPGSKPKYTPEEKAALIQKQMEGLENGTIKPEFAYKNVEADKAELEKFNTYFQRFMAGEVTADELRIYEGDWLLALKEKDRKKKQDFISGDGFRLRRDEVAVMQNRPLTDLGNAERLVDQYGTLIRFCHPMKEWFVWSYAEGRWAQDTNGYMNRISKDVVRRILIESSRAPMVDLGKKMASWAFQCECRTHIDGMMALAQSDKKIVVSPDDFDKDLYLFNLLNGTFNLKTLELQPHDKNNNISHLANFDYNPNAKCPMFLKYLDRIFQSNPHKDEIIKFLQRAIGYTLSGSIEEQCLFLLYGSGANGKSVFLEVFLELMGEYGTVAQSKSFTTDRGDQSNDIAALAGKRFVCASENTSTSHLDEAIIKAMTGGEKITARFLHKEFFSYMPQFKIWWAFNHPPNISDMTPSIWRRIKIIPFTEKLPESEWDKKLGQKLKDQEMAGIFNWAVEGLREYQTHGLQPPTAVTEATRQYKNDQDILLDFMKAAFETTESERDMVKASDVYTSYKNWWLNIESTKPMSSTKLGRMLRDRGMNKIELRDGTYYTNLKIKKYI